MATQLFGVSEAELAAGLAAASVATFYIGLSSGRRRHALDSRIRRLGTSDSDRRFEPSRPRQTRSGSELSAEIQRRLSRSSLGAIVQDRLVHAGSTWKPSQFIFLQIVAGGVASFVALLGTAAAGTPVRLLVSAALGVAGFAAPLLSLRTRAKKRLAAFEKQLPQAIDAMAGTLQAGSTLAQAMELIAREMPAPISVEFRRVLREIELGYSMADSLPNIMSRVPSTDLVLLTSAIDIQHRVGGDLAEMLKGISQTIRERLRIRSEVKVLTAQGRYSAYIVTALPVLMFCFLWFTANDYIAPLLLPGITRVMLIAAIAGVIFGFFSMKKIATIDV